MTSLNEWNIPERDEKQYQNKQAICFAELAELKVQGNTIRKCQNLSMSSIMLGYMNIPMNVNLILRVSGKTSVEA